MVLECIGPVKVVRACHQTIVMSIHMLCSVGSNHCFLNIGACCNCTNPKRKFARMSVPGG